MNEPTPVFSVHNLDFYYGAKHALVNVNLTIAANQITAFTGPSGCGKSTFLRCLNRLNEAIPGTRVTGKILLDGKDIYAPDLDLVELRRRVGMVCQKPKLLPQSIYNNVAFGPRVFQKVSNKAELDEAVETSLRAVALWDEIKDQLHENALELTLERQQRLCMARALATSPQVILMDEATAALDPITTGRIEDLLIDLKKDYTIVMVTHSMQQASRVSDFTGLFWLGELVEFSSTNEMLTRPKKELTESYIAESLG